MAFSFAFDSATRVLLARFEGHITDEVMEDFYHRAKHRIATASELRGTIVDFSPVVEFKVTPEMVREVAWSPPIETDASRPVVAVAPSAEVFEIMWILVTEGQETRPNFHLVKSLEHAYAIVGITNPNFVCDAQAI